MTDSGLHLLRSFAWGLLLVTDRGIGDLPHEVPAAPQLATATRTALAINVRHAADVDGDEDPAVVNIPVVLGPAPVGTGPYRAEVELTTGVIEIGDAEAVDELSVRPGTYVVAMRVSPADDPDHVELWIERVGQLLRRHDGRLRPVERAVGASRARSRESPCATSCTGGSASAKTGRQSGPRSYPKLIGRSDRSQGWVA